MSITRTRREIQTLINSESREFALRQLHSGYSVVMAVHLISDRARMQEEFRDLGFDSVEVRPKAKADIGSNVLTFVGPNYIATGCRIDRPVSLVVTRPESYRIAIRLACSVPSNMYCYIPYVNGKQLHYIRRGLDRNDRDVMAKVYAGQYIGDYP